MPEKVLIASHLVVMVLMLEFTYYPSTLENIVRPSKLRISWMSLVNLDPLCQLTSSMGMYVSMLLSNTANQCMYKHFIVRFWFINLYCIRVLFGLDPLN
jgi:hypothetical protein